MYISDVPIPLFEPEKCSGCLSVGCMRIHCGSDKVNVVTTKGIHVCINRMTQTGHINNFLKIKQEEKTVSRLLNLSARNAVGLRSHQLLTI